MPSTARFAGTALPQRLHVVGRDCASAASASGGVSAAAFSGRPAALSTSSGSAAASASTSIAPSSRTGSASDAKLSVRPRPPSIVLRRASFSARSRCSRCSSSRRSFLSFHRGFAASGCSMSGRLEAPLPRFAGSRMQRPCFASFGKLYHRRSPSSVASMAAAEAQSAQRDSVGSAVQCAPKMTRCCRLSALYSATVPGNQAFAGDFLPPQGHRPGSKSQAEESMC
eukprot:6938898-Prymnesium_polylepis.1